MPVQMQQFRVVGVNRTTGEDVSVDIEAATKAAAEVKAEQMDIETTHIARLKSDQPVTADEQELFSREAAEALTATRTDKLIEEVVEPEEAKITPDPPTPPAPKQQPDPVVEVITRPNYAAPAKQSAGSSGEVSDSSAFALVMFVLLGICSGAYFVLVHEPNSVHAENTELVFGDDAFSDVVDPNTTQSSAPMRDAFNERAAMHTTPQTEPPIAPEQQIDVTRQDEAQANASADLVLQSIVSSHEGKFAVINGRLIREGAVFNESARLVSIGSDFVLVEQGDTQTVLGIASDDE